MAWHTADEKSLHSALTDAVSHLNSVYTARRETWRQALSRYLDRQVTLGEAEVYQTECYTWNDRKARNAIASVIETVHSHCTTMKPRPAFRTVGNSARLQQRVKLLQRAIDSLLDKQDVENEAARVCLDALIGGAGHVRVSVEDGTPTAERVAPYRLLLDPAEMVLRRPLTYYYVYYADADALKEQYCGELEPGEERTRLERACGGAPVLSDNNTDDSGCVVQCIEAIRIPSCRDGEGRRAVFTSNGILEDEPYTYPEAPFFSLLWLQNPESPYGIGVSERLAGVQEDIDQREEVVRDHEAAIAGMWLLPTGCGISPEMLDNRRKALPYTPVNGLGPQYVYPQAVAADVYQSRESSVQAAYQFSGVTQLAATGEKPGGVTAAAALRRLEVVGSRRFARFYQDYQSMVVWVGKMFAYMIARDPNVRRRSRLLIAAGHGMQTIKLSDVRVDPDLVDVRVRVSSFNATGEPELLQELNEYFNGGLFTREQVIRLQQTRDLEAEYDLLTAPTDLVDSLLEQMLANEVFLPPEPFYDLQLCLDRAVLYYQRAVLGGVKPSRLALLRDWIRAVLDLQGLTQPQPAPAPPMPGAGPAGPPAAGMPPPGMGPMPPQGAPMPMAGGPPPPQMMAA